MDLQEGIQLVVELLLEAVAPQVPRGGQHLEPAENNWLPFGRGEGLLKLYIGCACVHEQDCTTGCRKRSTQL